MSSAFTATQMLLVPEMICVLHKNSCPRKTEVLPRKFAQFSFPMQQDKDWTNQLALLPRWMWSTAIVERITLRSQCSHAAFIIYSPEGRRGRKKICDLLTLWSSEVFVNHNFPDMKDLFRRAEKEHLATPSVPETAMRQWNPPSFFFSVFLRCLKKMP